MSLHSVLWLNINYNIIINYSKCQRKRIAINMTKIKKNFSGKQRMSIIYLGKTAC
ncbi:hypothetical protein DCCM_4063 [Desulfocucumis palustris]|uniref:Uncharacterized protein n=1 Tax=Desulfocucumis palustris TaxID=1898651 RepID=A0A2L2XGV0_9FIRM|nr:hypothetical protein DCCM_4063 [Desulfocucumis palustris]